MADKYSDSLTLVDLARHWHTHTASVLIVQPMNSGEYVISCWFDKIIYAHMYLCHKHS